MSAHPSMHEQRPPTWHLTLWRATRVLVNSALAGKGLIAGFGQDGLGSIIGFVVFVVCAHAMLVAANEIDVARWETP